MDVDTIKQDFYHYSYLHSIHYRDLYRAPSKPLLRSTPNLVTMEKDSLR